MAHINCTRCQKVIPLAPGSGSGRVICPGCAKTINVQRVRRASAEDALPENEAAGEPKRDVTRRFTGKHWAIAGLGGLAAVFALAVGIWLAKSRPSKEVAGNTRSGSESTSNSDSGRGARGIGEVRSPSARGADVAKVAVLVGVNRYKQSSLNGNRPLQYAENDVAEMRDVLSRAGYTVHLLTGPQATLGNIRSSLEAARKQTTDGGVFLVGLAGHGFQPEKSDSAYFCPYDTDQRVAGKDEDPWDYQTMLPMEDVLAHMKASSAGSRVLMMDACRNDPLAGRGRGVGTNLKISEIPNTAVLLSCSQGQKSFEDKAWGGGHGVFFHHVLTGLRGDEESVIADGKIDLDLLVAYLKKAVPKQVKEVAKDPFSGAAPDQNPHRIVNGNVDLLISAKGVNGPIPLPKFDNPEMPTPEKPVVLPEKDFPSRPRFDPPPKKDFPFPKRTPADPYAGKEQEFEIAKSVRMTFCWVPAGKTTLGSPAGEKDRSDDEKEHEFTTTGFWLGKYEVQQSEWEGVMGSGSNKSKFKGATLPVETVSWNDCKEFIGKCEAKGLTVKLPHEDEWEYACRGGNGNKQAFYWGDVLNGDKANHSGPYGTATKGDYKEKTTPVGTYKDKAPHPWGLCDMSGNVWEWCENTYTTTGVIRTYRGGSWLYDAGHCRSAHRFPDVPTYRRFDLGFRLALVP